MSHHHDSANLTSHKGTGPSRPMAALRKLVRDAAERTVVERCELCSVPLPPEHQHLIEPANRRLVCSCDACAVLFDLPAGGRYRRVPRQTRLLADFSLTDATWDRFLIPINMSFFFENSFEERVVAQYPSPAGATESLVDPEAWQGLVAENPILREMQSDVEALLVNRLGARYGFESYNYYIAPIDECYKLVGLLRTHWHGFSGGTEVWQQITEFYKQLKQRSITISAARVKASKGQGDRHA